MHTITTVRPLTAGQPTPCTATSTFRRLVPAALPLTTSLSGNLPSWQSLQVRVLNEAEPACNIETIFRPWSARLDHPEVSLRCNEDDDELLLHIPFEGNARLRAICIIGAPDGAAPLSMKAYTNRDDLDFSAVSSTPATQSWDLQDNLRGDIEYPTL